MSASVSFEKRVLDLVSCVPKGRVTTYKEIARALKTRAYRAVGTALHNNKDLIIIPCHRVVRSDGYVGGYSRGTAKKVFLLRSEGVTVKKRKVSNLDNKVFRF